MKKPLSILFVGESVVAHTIEFKGYDSFTSTRYHESAIVMRKVFEKEGHRFTHIPCHRVHLDFPTDLDSLSRYDVVLMSDVGSNTMLLHPETARFSKRTVNTLKLIKEYVANGGGYGMIGGYMTFQGIEAKGKYKGTPIEEILPVTLLPYDDRVEIPEGADLRANPESHVILNGLPEAWPYILGYNRLIPKAGAEVLVANEDDPIIAVGTYGKGRTLAYATDCAPHWAPPALCEWEHYSVLWDRLARWLAQELSE
ncbi:glutamine amidotransferase [Paenibacillus montanisoli]|uniref:Cytoplasmic protein n=1 Tax=Paenibacillus montanisoli TaxID=2081970 RepID=A0A328TWZ6_9BACL|nr:glutamine amidotransferase [Paenibacillus montanisoli]RAP74093.1 cytoplasmic protein [Paenibacillus montanisoli]